MALMEALMEALMALMEALMEALMALMEALMALMALMVDSSTFIPIKTFLFSASQNLSSKMLVFNVRKDQELYPPLAAFGFPKLSKMRVQYSFRSQKRKNVNKNPDSQRPQHPAPSKIQLLGIVRHIHTYSAVVRRTIYTFPSMRALSRRLHLATWT